VLTGWVFGFFLSWLAGSQTTLASFTASWLPFGYFVVATVVTGDLVNDVERFGTAAFKEQVRADADDFEERTATERIVLFLDEHDDRAWKAATIAERLGLETDAVSAILSRLKDRGLVRHKRPYWAITDDEERLEAAYQLHRHHETAADRYGEEHLEELQTDEMEDVQ
jgi:hypothetical protein